MQESGSREVREMGQAGQRSVGVLAMIRVNDVLAVRVKDRHKVDQNEPLFS